MAKINSYKDLQVWQKAIQLVTDVYMLTKSFPKDEVYALTSQIRRAAISIPSNIAEGQSKRSTKDYIRFLNIAYGSCAELETQLCISTNLHYATSEQTQSLSEKGSEIGRMINGLINSLENSLTEARSLKPEASYA